MAQSNSKSAVRKSVQNATSSTVKRAKRGIYTGRIKPGK